MEKKKKNREGGYNAELIENLKKGGIISLNDFKELIKYLEKKYFEEDLKKESNIPYSLLYTLKQKRIVETLKDGNTTLISFVNEEDRGGLSLSKSGRKMHDLLKKKLIMMLEKMDKNRSYTYPELTGFLKPIQDWIVNKNSLMIWNDSAIKSYGLEIGIINTEERTLTPTENSRKLLEILKKEKTVMTKDEESKSISPVENKEVEKIENETKIKSEEITDFENSYLNFVLAGMISQLGKPVNLINLPERLDLSGVNLRINPSSKLDKNIFDIKDDGNINLKVSWEKVKEMYNPKKFKEQFLARISMTIEDIKLYLPNSEIKIVSKITDLDNIYSIEIDRSVSTFRNLSKLYKTFRGTDIIFDNILTDKLNKFIEQEEERSYRYFFPIDIEK